MVQIVALPVLGFLCFWRLASAMLERFAKGDLWDARLLLGLEGAFLAILIAYVA
jgi:hypothetical protein